ncbi:MAG TPA: VIT1/CCC1 family protein [Treponemataceae bacterium]|nr:VIT1/CCC1 family protein [Treponemataceae bacterium]
MYQRLADRLSDRKNAEVLARMAAEEARHAARWRAVTNKDVGPDRLRVSVFFFIARFLGLTFAIKTLEKGEGQAQVGYGSILDLFPDAKAIIAEEDAHEDALIAMIDEERLKYAGSVVLGLNDALVELTGALAGFTFAFQDSRLIALTGLITGIAASFSMAASEYLSQRSDAESELIPWKSSLYTGVAYIVTVILLVLPFLLLENYLLALGLTLSVVVLIIVGFNYYLCTAKDLPFRRHFLEMFVVSMGVTVLSFGVGLAVKHFLGVTI